MYGLAWYFCCLNPRERTVLRSTALALPLTLFLGVPRDLWDTFWLGLPNVTPEVKLAFLSVYGLEIVTIVEDGVDVEVVRPAAGQLVYWTEAGVFVFTPEAACLSGCEQSSYGNP